MTAKTCLDCAHVRSFKPRADEQDRYGFGVVGWGCQKRGWEGYCSDPSRPPCGGQFHHAKAMEARQGGNGEAGAVHDSAVPDRGFAHPTGSIKGGDRG